MVCWEITVGLGQVGPVLGYHCWGQVSGVLGYQCGVGSGEWWVRVSLWGGVR